MSEERFVAPNSGMAIEHLIQYGEEFRFYPKNHAGAKNIPATDFVRDYRVTVKRHGKGFVIYHRTNCWNGHEWVSNFSNPSPIDLESSLFALEEALNLAVYFVNTVAVDGKTYAERLKSLMGETYDERFNAFIEEQTLAQIEENRKHPENRRPRPKPVE